MNNINDDHIKSWVNQFSSILESGPRSQKLELLLLALEEEVHNRALVDVSKNLDRCINLDDACEKVQALSLTLILKIELMARCALLPIVRAVRMNILEYSQHGCCG